MNIVAILKSLLVLTASLSLASAKLRGEHHGKQTLASRFLMGGGTMDSGGGGSTPTLSVFNTVPVDLALVTSDQVQLDADISDSAGHAIRKVTFTVTDPNGVATGYTPAEFGGTYGYALTGLMQGRYSWTVYVKNSNREELTTSPTYFDVLLPTDAPVVPPTDAPVAPTDAPVVPPTDAPVVPPPTEAPVVAPTDPPVVPPTDAPVATPAIVYGLQEECLTNDPSKYNICLDLKSISGNYESWMAAYADAKVRWEEVITGDDGGAMSISGLDPANIATAIPASVDDIYIAGIEEYIDGAYGILGSAGPTLGKWSGSFAHTLSGKMRFDSADIARLQTQGTWTDVILHEIGHVLGIGTWWDFNNMYDAAAANGVYLGANANAEWTAICGGSFAPVEMDGGGGTAGGHWDEDCVGNELMSGWLTTNSKLSKLTIASLKDMGFTVDMNAADPFTSADLGSCAAYCPNRRHLEHNVRRKTPPSQKGLENMSATAQADILTEAAAILSEARAKAPVDLPENVHYAAGEWVTIFYSEPGDGEIRDFTIEWSDDLPDRAQAAVDAAAGAE